MWIITEIVYKYTRQFFLIIYLQKCLQNMYKFFKSCNMKEIIIFKYFVISESNAYFVDYKILF